MGRSGRLGPTESCQGYGGDALYISAKAKRLLMVIDGGPGSGNWGHKGRPGLVGGSGKGGGKMFRSGNASSGYSSFKRHTEFKGISEKVGSSKTAKSWLESMSEGERQALSAQYRECGTKETEEQYQKRMFEMLRGKPEDKSSLPKNWRESLDSLSQWKVDQLIGESDDIPALIEPLSHSPYAAETLGKIGELCDWKDRMIDRQFENLSDDESKDLNFLLDQFPWDDEHAKIPNESKLNLGVSEEVRQYYNCLKFKALGFDVTVPKKPEGVKYLQKYGSMKDRMSRLNGGVVHTPAGDQNRASVKRMMTQDRAVISNVLSGCPDNMKQRIIASVDDMDDRVAELVARTLPKAKVNFYPGKGETCYQQGSNSIQIFTEPYLDGTRDDIEHTYWHEYGHYLDFNSTLTGQRFYADPLSHTIELGGARSIAGLNKARRDAAAKDVGMLLERAGLSDKYGVHVGEDGFHIERKADGREISVFVNDSDTAMDKFAITEAVSNAIKKWAGDYEAEEYPYTQGRPRQPNYDEYFEYYTTPKRHQVKRRERFKGAEEAYYKASVEYGQKLEDWETKLGPERVLAVYEKQRAMRDAAEKKKSRIGGMTDSLDESVTGLFGMCIMYGGHDIQYYTHRSPGLETTANVFSALALRNKDELDFMQTFLPNTADLYTRAWRFDGP